MSHSYVSCYIHYVFSTKDRIKTINPEVKERLWAYMGGIAKENNMKALIVGGTSNHVHILLEIPSTITIAKAIQLNHKYLIFMGGYYAEQSFASASYISS